MNSPLYLNFPRHYNELNQLAKYNSYYDKPFLEKFPVAVWRGASTGYHIDGHNSRGKLVEKYFDKKINPPRFSLENAKMVVQKVLGLYRPKSKVDICFSKLTQGATHTKGSQKYYSQFVCPGKSMKEMLLYRYLISVEGNDVATGLKWMLYSNSVVFMQPPTLETRFREGSVIPWLHYIPLAEDFTDLMEKIQFCDNHVFICQKVAEMGTEFARHRIIGENEADDVNANIFKNYLDMYEINIVEKDCNVEVDCVE